MLCSSHDVDASGLQMKKTITHIVDDITEVFDIRSSNSGDMQQIHRWLIDEDAQGIHGNFLCNWDLILMSHEKGELLVLIHEADGIPVAFLSGRLLFPGILQVRNDWRGKGIGRIVVEHCVELALLDDEMVLVVECSPSSSIPFWEVMGFNVVEGEFGKNAKGYRLLHKELALPCGGMKASVEISSFPEERKWKKEDVLATVSYSFEGVIADDGNVYLPLRASFPISLRSMSGDPVIEIIIDGEVVCCNKVKYPDALSHGVKMCANGFFMDTVVR